MNQIIPSSLSRDENEFAYELRELVDMAIRSRKVVAATTVVVLALVLFGYWVSAPVFRADALVQVENSKSPVTGQNDLASLLTAGGSRSASEIEIIRSRSVISLVVADLKLDISASPVYFPLIGAPIARRHKASDGLAGAFPGFDRFGWGGESIAVTRLDVPREFEEEPFLLVPGEQGTYRLFDEDDVLVLEGKVGKPAESKNGDKPVSLFVSELRARPGTHFTLVKHSFDEMVSGLQKNIKVAEKGRQTGILQLSLEGGDPERIAETINGIVTAYLRQNVERQSEEARRMLEFLNEQLPRLKSEVDTSETALKNYKSSTGTAVDISVEGQELLSRVTEVEKELTGLELERSELTRRYTGQHPALVSMNEKIDKLKAQRAQFEEMLKRLPNTEWKSLSLVRDVKVANELYVLLLNKAQELKVAKAGTIGNVRVLDEAVVPRKKISPRLRIVGPLGLVGGLILGFIAAFLMQAMRRTIQDPETLDQKIGVPVYAIVPHSRAQRKVAKAAVSVPSGELAVLAKTAPQENTVEALRSLRTSLQFAFANASSQVLAIHSATPAAGKSFVSSNLAYLLTDLGKRVLLIDCDLRMGHLHEIGRMARSPGLAEYLAGSAQLPEVVRSLNGGKLHFIATGTLPPNPAELLMHNRFAVLLKQAAEQYDHVIVDCSPVLNLADAIAIAKQAGANIMIVRAGITTLDDLQFAIKRLSQNGIRLDGLVFNDLNLTGVRKAYGAYYGREYPTARA